MRMCEVCNLRPEKWDYSGWSLCADCGDDHDEGWVLVQLLQLKMVLEGTIILKETTDAWPVES